MSIIQHANPEESLTYKQYDSVDEKEQSRLVYDYIMLQSASTQIPMGEALAQAGLIEPQQIDITLQEQRHNAQLGRRQLFGQVLLSLNFISDTELCAFLAQKTNIPVINLDAITTTTTSGLIPEQIARSHLIAPLHYSGNELHLAIYDPYDIAALDLAQRYFPRHYKIKPFIAPRSSILEFLDRAYGEIDTSQKVSSCLHSSDGGLGESAQKLISQAPHSIVNLVDQIIVDSIIAGASDIHIEPELTFVRVRIRVDGLLKQLLVLHNTHWNALSHRVKIIAGMDIGDTRKIQDGRFQFSHRDKNFDCRVAIMPTSLGEHIAIRLLDQNKILYSLNELGFIGQTLDTIQKILKRPEGMVLVTGPTGSGKTTTLYSFLNLISSTDIHVATLEDPVEYQIELVKQTNVNLAQGIDFASGVRGILRMDPDAILIGEIRDSDTAQMALRAAMTGHRVMSTLHCNDAISSVARLNDLAISGYMLSANISGVIAQRLARRLCPECTYTRPISANEHAVLSRFSNIDTSTKIFESHGCEKCNTTGINGRTVIAEALYFSPKIDELLTSNAKRTDIYAQALTEGFVSMQQDGVNKMISGELSFSELTRIIDLSKG